MTELDEDVIAARVAIDACPSCGKLPTDVKERKAVQVAQDIARTRARTLTPFPASVWDGGHSPRAPKTTVRATTTGRATRQMVALPPVALPPLERAPVATWVEDKSPHPEETRRRNADKARNDPEWFPGEKASRLGYLGWLDVHAPDHQYTTVASRASIREAALTIARDAEQAAA